MENKVLMVVAGEEITEKDLNDFMENVPQEQQAYRSNPQFRQQCLEQLTALRMFTKQGEEQKLDETEFLNIRKYTPGEIEEMIQRGAFQQAVHIMAWLLARRR